MKCPKCGKERCAIIDSRNVADGVKRRRKCEDCGEKFSTFECGNELMRRLQERAAQMGMEKAKKEVVDAVTRYIGEILMERART